MSKIQLVHFCTSCDQLSINYRSANAALYLDLSYRPFGAISFEAHKCMVVTLGLRLVHIMVPQPAIDSHIAYANYSKFCCKYNFSISVYAYLVVSET